MTFAVTVPAADEVPVWAFVVAGVVAWYVFAAAVVRWSGYMRLFPSCDPADRFIVGWALSPVVMPFTAVCIALGVFTEYVLTPKGER